MSGSGIVGGGILTFSYEGNLPYTGGWIQQMKAPVSGRVKWVTASVRTPSNENGFYVAIENDNEDRMHDESIFLAVNNRAGESGATTGSSDYSFQRGDDIYLNIWGITEGDAVASLIVNIAYESATEAEPSYIQPDKRFG